MKQYFYHNNKIRVTLESFNSVREILKELLFRVDKLLRRLDIKYTIACGNLLEYERGSPIYHDDDIDIRVDSRDWYKWDLHLLNKGNTNIENDLFYKKVTADNKGRWYHIYLLNFDNIKKKKGIKNNAFGLDFVSSDSCANDFWKKYDINFDDLRNVVYLDINTFAPNINDTKKVLIMDYGPNFIIPNYKPYTIISERFPLLLNNLDSISK